MDERLSKALDFSNYAVTLNNQRRALKEKFLSDTVFYHAGGSFTVTKELINFTKTLVDTGNDTNVVLIDDNDVPLEIADLNEFMASIMDLYFTASNNYYTTYQTLRKNRSVQGLVE
jgi:hypothetical protein